MPRYGRANHPIQSNKTIHGPGWGLWIGDMRLPICSRLGLNGHSAPAFRHSAPAKQSPHAAYIQTTRLLRRNLRFLLAMTEGGMASTKAEDATRTGSALRANTVPPILAPAISGREGPPRALRGSVRNGSSGSGNIPNGDALFHSPGLAAARRARPTQGRREHQKCFAESDA